MQGESGRDPGSARAPAAREDLVAALRRHGIAGAVAAELWRIARRLTADTRRRGLEYAVTLDAADGKAIDSTLTGSATSTDLTRHLQAFQPGRTYVSLHTHPRSTSFSDLDVRMLAQVTALQVMIVVGVDGTWYILSRAPGTRITDPYPVFADFVTELQRWRQDDVAAAEKPHLATERVAARHGLLYDRVMGPCDG